MSYNKYAHYGKTIFLRAAVFATFFIATSVKAETINVIGTGGLSCGSWIEARNKGNDVQENLYVQWIAGYLAGHNAYRTKGVKQVAVSDLPTISLWLDTYCRKNPTHLAAAAAIALVQELGGTKALHAWKR